MLDRLRFATLEDALEAVCCSEAKPKDNLKVAMGYLLQTAAEVMQGVYLAVGRDEASKEMKKFVKILKYKWGELFGEALYKATRRGQERLRRPAELPVESDLQRLKEYCVKKMTELSNDYELLDVADFRRLRAVIVTRLALFNARRGGEPAKMTLDEFAAAKDGEWLDRQHTEYASDEESEFLRRFKLAYQSGKGTKDLVPVLIPEDTYPALIKLVEARDDVGIDRSNQFVFANTQGSHDHVIGWQMIKEVCKAANVKYPHLVTANHMRHRAATIYAHTDVPAPEREAFFRHMAHSREMDEKVYQCPLGVMEVCKVGRYLTKLDQGRGSKSTGASC